VGREELAASVDLEVPEDRVVLVDLVVLEDQEAPVVLVDLVVPEDQEVLAAVEEAAAEALQV
jgi:hypothetical protein